LGHGCQQPEGLRQVGIGELLGVEVAAVSLKKFGDLF
jgi:hypothetical protein